MSHDILCQAMVDNGRVDLLMHPLTQRFLEMKWQAYGKAIHLSNLLVFLVFLGFITFFAVGFLGIDDVTEEVLAATESSIQSTESIIQTTESINEIMKITQNSERLSYITGLQNNTMTTSSTSSYEKNEAYIYQVRISSLIYF